MDDYQQARLELERCATLLGCRIDEVAARCRRLRDECHELALQYIVTSTYAPVLALLVYVRCGAAGSVFEAELTTAVSLGDCPAVPYMKTWVARLYWEFSRG